MDNKSSVIEYFEAILQKECNKKPAALYKGTKKAEELLERTQDVIDSVNIQIKAIQVADRVKSGRLSNMNYKKSNFITVDNLPSSKEEVEQQINNKFETQCVSDTQLIEVVKIAEILDIKKGITQEFNNTFCCKIFDKDMCSDKNVSDIIKNVSDTEIDNIEIVTQISSEIKKTSQTEVKEMKNLEVSCFSSEVFVESDEKCMDLQFERHKYNSALSENVKKITQTVKNFNTVESFNEDTQISDNKMVSLSPILNIKSTNLPKSPSPLIFDLEAFENFESITFPKIIDDIHLNTTRYSVNSQKFGTERISTATKQEADLHTQSLNIQQDVRNLSLKIPVKLENIKINDTLQDEILFSSDEEENYVPKQSQDLPFTCALETSFYDQSDILDKTMYVGFQTASNKSIQVSSETFNKAKTIFNEIDNKYNKKECTITELLEKCDDISKSESCHNLIKHNKGDNDRHKLKYTGNQSENDEAAININYVTEEGNLPKRIAFQGVENGNLFMLPDNKENLNRFGMSSFVTASNKNIRLSDIALIKCKKVFQGIDLYDHFITENKENIISKEHVLNSDISKINDEFTDIKDETNKAEALPNIVDEHILQEFQNSEMIRDDLLKETNTSVNTMNFIVYDNIKKNNKEFGNHHVETCCSSSPNINDFKIGSNKYVETMSKSETILNDLHCTDGNLKSCGEKNINRETMKVFGNCSANTESLNNFKTASNKPIFICKEALIRTKHLFRDIDIPTHEKHNEPNNKGNLKFQGFKTANNKEIKVSYEALDKSRKLFENIALELSDVKNEQNFLENQNIITETDLIDDHVCKNIVGFKTANNKEIKISNEALHKSKKLFEDIDLGLSVDKIINSNNDQIEQDFLENQNKITEFHLKDSHIPKNVGFKTASNKSVTISKQALEKSMKLFQDLNQNEVLHRGNSEEDDNNLGKVYKPLFGGFQTASNKTVKISAQGLAKIKNIFQEFDVNTCSKSEEISLHLHQKAIALPGFESTSNKITTSIDKAKIINKIEDTCKLNKIIYNIDKIDSNRQNLTECDLADKHKCLPSNHKPISSFKGFQTASNKEVKISEEALAKCRQIFQDKDLSSQNLGFINENCIVATNIASIENESNILNSLGCKSASNGNILNSDDDLLKSKMLLNESENKTVDMSAKSVDVEIDKFEDKEHHLQNIMNTQIMDNFDETLYTEDFRNDLSTNKRPRSPILSCPRAKKRKFETPYKSYQGLIEITKADDNEIKNKLIFNDDYKRSKLYKLKDIKVMESKYSVTNINTCNTTFDNLLDFIFSDKRNKITNTALHTEDLKEIFLSSVNQKLVPEGWLDNHLKLIMWKLLSYESVYPNTLGIVCTVRNVLNQLKYRYNRELYNAERPALRKILEKDDVPSKTIVLCVVDIIKCELDDKSVTSLENKLEVSVTDGWYCVKACLDKMLTEYVFKNKLVVGTKIVTNGAELLNCDQGVSPWEDTSSVRLKLFGNSTRRARWDSKLGYHGNVSIISRLSLVRPNGGKVSKLRVLVTRVYPVLYIEKFEDGNTVTRSERLEHLHEMKYESERQALLEKLYEEVEKEFSDTESQDSEDMLNSSNKRNMPDSRISKYRKTSLDHFEFGNHLTESQAKLLQDRASKRRERLLRDVQTRLLEKMEKHGLCQKRNVVTLLKIRIADVEEKGDEVVVTKGMMSIWKPNESVLELIREGVWINVMNVVPTSVRYSELHMSAGRQSVFCKSKYIENDKIKPHIRPLLRNCYHIKELIRKSSIKIDYNEIDTVGIIVSIEPSTQSFESIKNQFQNVFLADENKNMICVNFWGGLKKFGFEKVLDTGQIVACVNLQERVGNIRNNVPQYRVTEFTCFTKSPKNVKAREMMECLDKKIVLDRRKFCEDCVNLKSNVTSLQNNENVTPYRINNVNLVKNRMFINTPTGVKVNVTDDLDLSGLDFESTFKQKDTQELLSPKALMRKRQVQEKINRLKMYGEPPPLSSIHIINKSVIKSYKSPLGNPDNSVATRKNIPEISRPMVSPLTSVNRTSAKNCINPVKINFNNADNNTSGVDHFAEEFDGSPPLSLE